MRSVLSRRPSRRFLTLGVAAALAVTLVQATAPAAAAGALHLPGPPGHRVLDRERRRLPRGGRGRRQHRHPVVQPVQRRAVAPGRPRRHVRRRRGAAELGGRVRARLHRPGLRQRLLVVHCVHHGDGNRWRASASGHRHRPVRPAQPHRAGHPVRLLAVGVPGVRHPERRRPTPAPTVCCRTTNPATASTFQDDGACSGCVPARVTDYDPATRWATSATNGWVDPGWITDRPRRDRDRQQGRPAMGSGVRDGVPAPGVGQQHHLDDDLPDQRGPRLQGDADRQRHRPVRPDVRHRAVQRLRLLAVGVPGVRHRRQPDAAAAAAPPAPNFTRLAWSDEFNGANGSTPDTAKWKPEIGPRRQQRAAVLHEQQQRADGRRRQPGDPGAARGHARFGVPAGPVVRRQHHVPVHVRPAEHQREVRLHVRPSRGAHQGVERHRACGRRSGCWAATSSRAARGRRPARSTSSSTSARSRTTSTRRCTRRPTSAAAGTGRR